MMSSLHLWERVKGKYVRGSADLFCRRPFVIRSKAPIVSFTFDDFPRSALHVGGAVLKQVGAVGTYYASFGLMGQTNTPTGTIFTREDLQVLLAEGHELGCHTFEHCDAWDTQPSAFEAAVIKNRSVLNELAPGASFKTLSYPISVPRPLTKKRVTKHFACCRCGGQRFNVGTVDLNYLSAYFLEKTRGDLATVTSLVEKNRVANGWLIFATHDLSSHPTPYGCTPDYFERVVRTVKHSGARILPVAVALETLRGEGSGPTVS